MDLKKPSRSGFAFEFAFAQPKRTFKGSFTPSKDWSESEKDQRINDKHQGKFSLPLLLNVNGCLMAYSHQAKSATKTKTIKEQAKKANEYAFQ